MKNAAQNQFLKQLYVSSALRAYCLYENLAVNALSMRYPDLKAETLQCLFYGAFAKVDTDELGAVCKVMQPGEYMLDKAQANGWSAEAVNGLETTLKELEIIAGE